MEGVEALGRVEGCWGRTLCKQLGWLGKARLSHFLWGAGRMHLLCGSPTGASWCWREMLRRSVLTRNGPAGLVVTDTALSTGCALSERSREGLRAAAGAETAPSKAWGTNRAGAVPVPQLLLEPLAAVTWRASAHFQHLPTPLGSRARGKIAIAAIPCCPLSRAVHRLREDPLRAGRDVSAARPSDSPARRVLTHPLVWRRDFMSPWPSPVRIFLG